MEPIIITAEDVHPGYCPYCGEELDDTTPDDDPRAVVECKGCITRHHLACWNEAGGCTMPGCGQKDFSMISRPQRISGAEPVSELQPAIVIRVEDLFGEEADQSELDSVEPTVSPENMEPWAPMIVITNEDMCLPECPYCHVEIDNTRPNQSPVVECAACHSRHHLECWQANGGKCSIGFCGSTEHTILPTPQRATPSRQVIDQAPVVVVDYSESKGNRSQKWATFIENLKKTRADFTQKAREWWKKLFR